MTTRRRRPGPPGPPRGRIGLFGRSAIDTSVKPGQRRIDPHGAPQRPGEGAVRGRPLEAREAAARVDAAPLEPRARGQRALARDEADELALRRAPPAAGAGADRLVRQPAHPPLPWALPRPPAPRRCRPPQP